MLMLIGSIDRSSPDLAQFFLLSYISQGPEMEAFAAFTYITEVTKSRRNRRRRIQIFLKNFMLEA